MFKLGKIKFGVVGVVVVGGFLMGYGVCFVFGCNIGVYFGGIVLFSFYGWVWMVMVMFGIGLVLFIWLIFGFKNFKFNDLIC